jgi:hypothetical protein
MARKKQTQEEETSTSIWYILLIIVAVLFFTNPSLEDHQDATAKVASEILQETEIDGLLNIFGNAEDLFIKGIKSETKRNDYFLFSVTEIPIDEESGPTIIGVGILGYVHIFDEVKQELISKIELLKSGAGLLFK